MSRTELQDELNRLEERQRDYQKGALDREVQRLLGPDYAPLPTTSSSPVRDKTAILVAVAAASNARDVLAREADYGLVLCAAPRDCSARTLQDDIAKLKEALAEFDRAEWAKLRCVAVALLEPDYEPCQIFPAVAVNPDRLRELIAAALDVDATAESRTALANAVNWRRTR